jgi:uncharacterized protein YndB with AHSA1/START domain
MAKKIEVSVIIIERPIEEVWNLVTDLSKHSEWCAEEEKEQRTSPAPLGVGSTFMAGTPNGKKSTGRVDEYEPNRKVTFEATSGLEKGTKVSYTFEPVEGGKTRLRETVELTPKGFMRLLMPFVAGNIKRKVQASAERGFSNIKRILESEGQAVVR